MTPDSGKGEKRGKSNGYGIDRMIKVKGKFLNKCDFNKKKTNARKKEIEQHRASKYIGSVLQRVAF